MTKVLVTEDYLGDIADAIRAKNGGSDTYTPGQMAGAIDALPDAPVLVAKTITANGEYDPGDDNADGYSGVSVAVSGGSGGVYYARSSYTYEELNWQSSAEAE